MSLEARPVGEGDDDDLGATESFEVLAHGKHVLLAGQSSEMSVENEYDHPTPVLAEAPGLAAVVDEVDIGHVVAHPQRHPSGPPSRLSISPGSSHAEPVQAGASICFVSRNDYWGFDRRESGLLSA